MELKDFDVRKKGEWQYIGFWCKPENKEDAEKLARALRRIAESLADDVHTSEAASQREA
jgi:hypothetical protein